MYKIISHRGIHNKLINENSYEGIKLAFNDSKYVGVEFDIRETLDKEIILFHNNIYNNKLIKNTLYKELPKYVPKLKDILKINTNKIFLIEVKNINNYDKLINLLNKYKNKNIYIMSFSNNIINKLNITNREYKIGILNYVLNTNIDINKLDFVGILNKLINKDIINRLNKLDIFSYGLFKNKKYKDIYYIEDN